MKKLLELRQHLADTVPTLKRNPDRLHVWTEKGAAACGYGSLSHEWRYEAKILVEDFADPIETLTVPLLAWIEKNQANILLDADKRESALTVEAEILDHEKADVLITVAGITERIIVTAVEGGYQAAHCAEPALAGTEPPPGWPTNPDGTAQEFTFVSLEAPPA